MIDNVILAVGSVGLGSLLALSTTEHRVPEPAVCTDMCTATATVVAIPAGDCGASMPGYSVDYSGSYSGQCDGCYVLNHCHNVAKITITSAGGTALNGGGLVCGAGGTVTATIDTCGQAATSQINVHSGAPCTDANHVCTVYASIGCRNC